MADRENGPDWQALAAVRCVPWPSMALAYERRTWRRKGSFLSNLG
jgi:hypothetical protein